MIVTYDSAGVRRQAGMHAERINLLFEELLKGHLWNEEELREVFTHLDVAAEPWNPGDDLDWYLWRDAALRGHLETFRDAAGLPTSWTFNTRIMK
jgi:hypothetical protein